MIGKTAKSAIQCCASITVLIGVMFSSCSASIADEPVAVIENISPTAKGASAFELLEPGRSIQLGRDEQLIVSYFASCFRETITGGTVTIGATQSDVRQGKIERTKVLCDGGKLVLSPAEAAKSAALVLRDPPPAVQWARGTARRVFSPYPIVYAPACLTISVERLDQKAPSVTIAVKDNWADLARSGTKLAPGGHYRLVGGGRTATIVIEPSSSDTEGTLLGRIVAL